MTQPLLSVTGLHAGYGRAEVLRDRAEDDGQDQPRMPEHQRGIEQHADRGEEERGEEVAERTKDAFDLEGLFFTDERHDAERRIRVLLELRCRHQQRGDRLRAKRT